MKLRYAVALTLVIGLIAFDVWRECRPDVAAIRAQISRELPLGTRRDVVKRYLSNRRIETYELPGLPQIVYGETRCPGIFPMTVVVQRQFIFDKNDRLSRIEIDVAGEGP